MNEDKKNKSCACFGPGYRNATFVREVQICPICASSEPDIVLEELPTEPFRFEKVGTEENEVVRIRSDVSMLLHAADIKVLDAKGRYHVQLPEVRSGHGGLPTINNDYKSYCHIRKYYVHQAYEDYLHYQQHFQQCQEH
jgi:hypothetical protein